MPSANDRTIQIVATLDSKSPNGHSFAIDNGKGGPADLVFNKNTNGMKWDGYYLIEFQLKNENGANLVFAKDRDKVLWACPAKDAVNGCPPADSHMDTVFYVHPTKKIEDKKLYVINTDPEVVDFAFAFNFLNESNVGPKYVKYDPGGSNQNGGIPPFQNVSSFNAYLVIALVSAAVAAFATYGLMR